MIFLVIVSNREIWFYFFYTTVSNREIWFYFFYTTVSNREIWFYFSIQLCQIGKSDFIFLFNCPLIDLYLLYRKYCKDGKSRHYQSSGSISARNSKAKTHWRRPADVLDTRLTECHVVVLTFNHRLVQINENHWETALAARC